MKIAVISESAADEAAIHILIDSIIGLPTELVAPTRLRPGGWPHVLQVLPNIIRDLHYNSEANGLVVVVDSDDSPIHQLSEDPVQPCNPGCRLCLIRVSLRRSLDRLSQVPNRSELSAAAGVAVPAIEAWYRCGVDPHVNENTWIRSLRGEKIPYTRRSLKSSVYGSPLPTLETETELAIQSATRLAGMLDDLAQLFPIGFGCLVTDLRGWITNP